MLKHAIEVKLLSRRMAPVIHHWRIWFLGLIVGVAADSDSVGDIVGFRDVLNAIATWGGLLNERNMRGVFGWLERRGHAWWAGQWAQIILNQYNLKELHRALRAS